MAAACPRRPLQWVQQRNARGGLQFVPEVLRRRPVLTSAAGERELTQILMLVGRHRLLQRSYIEAGAEYELFRQLVDPPPPGRDDSFTGLTGTVQVGNVSDYQGYRVTALLGFELKRLDFTGQPSETRTRAFITIYAGIER